MRLMLAASLLLIAAPLAAQTIPDASALTPLPGGWTYANTIDGSEAVFAIRSSSGANTGANIPQLWVHCSRLTRAITIARPATGAAPFIGVWTSSATRNVPASFNPATARLTIALAGYDPLLDALAHSRGRIAFIIGTQPPLVVPPWPEPARVIDDCRS